MTLIYFQGHTSILNVKFWPKNSSSGRASASCAVGQDGWRIDTWPRHTKDVIKMVPVATLLGAQHYKASTGFSSLTNHASLTSHNEKKKKKKKKKSLIIINVCIDRRTEWKTGIRAKFVILLKYRNYYYYYYYYYVCTLSLEPIFMYCITGIIKEYTKRTFRSRNAHTHGTEYTVASKMPRDMFQRDQIAMSCHAAPCCLGLYICYKWFSTHWNTWWWPRWQKSE